MKVFRNIADSDRSLLLLSLLTPIVLALVAFVFAVGLTALGPPRIGALRSTTASVAYVYLMLGLLWLPAYLVACGWFWWATRDDESHDNLLKRLFSMPLVGAAFVWFPSLFFTPLPLAQKIRMYPLFAIAAVLGGYIWIGFIRLMFRAWRRI